MASFTDSPQTFFSQATPSVDLNLYGQTLDFKQAKYDQNVQRIQGSIDQVAGLDIMHPLAKDYLHTKLTEVGTKLSEVANGDWSAQSLVSQAMALAPQVAKDEKIQTALSATQQIRALSASQKKLYEKHPEMYPSSMRWMDNKAVSDYLNNNNLEEGYHGTSEASKYINYNKDIEALVKEIVPDVKLEVNADGRYQWKTEKYSTVTNDRIQSVISGYLSTNPEATKSLQADALFTYRDASPEFLNRHLDEVYSRNIHALENINKQYLDEILSHPSSRDFIEDRRAAMAANARSIQEMYDKRNMFREYLANPDMLDQVKQTVFTDNLKGMFSTIFQKDDIDRKIEQNYNATNADDFAIKRGHLAIDQAEFGRKQIETKDKLILDGFEPYLDKYGNPIPLTPDSKYWPQYQAHLKGKKGEKDGEGGSKSDYQFDGPSDIGEAKVEDKYGNIKTLDDQMNILKREIHNNEGTGLEDKFFEKWYKKNSALIPDKAQSRVAFDKMIKAQKGAMVDGLETTDEFREYWHLASKYQLKLDALDKLKEKALEHAQVKVQLPIKDKEYLQAISKIGSNLEKSHKTDESIVVGPGTNGNIATRPRTVLGDNTYSTGYAGNKNSYKRHKFNESLTIYPWGTFPTDTDDFNAPVTLPKDEHRIDENEVLYRRERRKIAVEVMKYKGSPFFDRLKKASDAGIDAFNKEIANVRQLENSITVGRKDATEQYLKENQKEFAPREFVLQGTEGSANSTEAKKRVYSILSNKQGISDTKTSYDLEKHSPEDITVLSASVNAAGYPRYKIQVKGSGVDYVTANQPITDNDKVLPIDPDAELKQIIKITGMTPTKGDGVLTTTDRESKIRYAIGTSGYSDNMYDAYVIIKGIPTEIKTTANGDIFHAATPSQIIKSLEDLARQPSRSNPKVPMSRQECEDKLTLPQYQYEAKYPKPTTNK